MVAEPRSHRQLKPGEEGFIPQAFIERYYTLNDKQKYHNMGEMIAECKNCRALFWEDEKNSMNCCKNGDMVLPPSRDLTDLLKRLFFNNPESSSFLKNIRQYNSALAFTSIKYTPDRRLGARAYNTSFQIQGELHHLQGSLMSRDRENPVYAQYFIYDPDEATRLRAARNANLSFSLFRDLDGIIRQFNPFYEIYKTAREVLKEVSDSQKTRLIISPRLNLIMEKGADRRRENLFTAHEIAFLIPGKDDKPGNRDLILTTRPARLDPD